ncbi:MAG: phycobilisome protein [Hydrococcus sp. SU_1_0]|nr:phycobilisome protein [Hydrococcus sp. SU_1_0]
MITEIDSLIYQAEAEYLAQKDLGLFKTQVLYLEERLKIYEQIRDQEAEIFQHVANQITTGFPDESEAKVSRAIKHWLMILRYCAMAMLSNDSKYLEDRILTWLPEQIVAHQLQNLEQTLYGYLQKCLKKDLGNEQYSILQPYLEQSQQVLLNQKPALEPV